MLHNQRQYHEKQQFIKNMSTSSVRKSGNSVFSKKKKPNLVSKYSSILKSNQLKQNSPSAKFNLNKKFQFHLKNQKNSSNASLARDTSPLNTQEPHFNSDHFLNKSNTNEEHHKAQLDNFANMNKYNRIDNFMNENQSNNQFLEENDLNDGENDDNVNIGQNEEDDYNENDFENPSDDYDFDENVMDGSSSQMLFSPQPHAYYSTWKNYNQQSHYQKNKRSPKKSYFSDANNSSSFKNYIIRTMSEILSSQLNLTRKVDQCRENFLIINRRLRGKFINFSVSVTFQKDLIGTFEKKCRSILEGVSSSKIKILVNPMTMIVTSTLILHDKSEKNGSERICLPHRFTFFTSHLSRPIFLDLHNYRQR